MHILFNIVCHPELVSGSRTLFIDICIDFAQSSNSSWDTFGYFRISYFRPRWYERHSVYISWSWCYI